MNDGLHGRECKYMKKNSLSCLMSLTAACVGLEAFVLFGQGVADLSLITHATECDGHVGYHYSYKAPTKTESGHLEFWTCCKCRQPFVAKPAGSFLDADDSSMTGGLDVGHAAYLASTEDSVFAGEDGIFEYSIVNPSSVFVHSLIGDVGPDLAIPSSVSHLGKDYEVIGIAPLAFYRNYLPVRTVSIPDSVFSIGSSAFWHAEALESVKFGSGLVEIGYNAFGECRDLEDFDLSVCTNLETIGDKAFQGCAKSNSELIRVSFPKSLRHIGSYAFWGSGNLIEYFIPSTIVSIGGYALDSAGSHMGFVFSDAPSRPDGWSHEFHHPERVTSCFGVTPSYGRKLDGKIFYLPTDAGEAWIVDVKDPETEGETIIIPEKVGGLPVKRILSFAFGYRFYEKVIIEAKITELESDSFYYSAGEVVLPDTCTKIRNRAFIWSKITTIDLKNVTEIENMAFSSCWYLTHIYIPSTVAKIGKDIFNGCKEVVIDVECEERPEGWDPEWVHASMADFVNWGVSK